MSEQTIVPFNSICFLFGGDMLFLWNKFPICFPIICAYFPFYFIFNSVPKFFSCFCSPGANFTVDKLFPISINSNPYPTVVFFEPIYECISSISTTSMSWLLRSSSSFSPKLLIQLKTATWLTFKKRPIERNPNPSKYRINASHFMLSDLPIYSTVKRYLHTLQRYLCLCLTIPSLRKTVLLQLGQLSIL